MTAWEAGMIASADRLNDLPGFQTYTPVLGSSGTAPTIGDGTITGRYLQMDTVASGALIVMHVVVTFGASSTYGSGAWNVSLPVGAKPNSILDCVCWDASGSINYFGGIRVMNSGTTGDLFRSSTNNGAGNITATVPMTWAAGDMWIIRGVYEAN